MSKITCKKCAQSFETLNKELAIESLICPFCGADNKGIKTSDDQSPGTEHSTSVSQSGQVSNEQSSSSHSGSVHTEQTTQSKRVMCQWEAEWRSNTVNAYINTLKNVFLRPQDYFATILPFKDYFSLALFIYINSFVTILFSMMFQIAFTSMVNPESLFGVPFMLCAALFMPLIAVGFTFLFGAILHLFISMIGETKKNYDTTITVYGLGTAAGLFGVIPFLGGLVTLVYTIVINILGQAAAHEIPPGKAALSVILPALVICCCIFTGVFALVSLVGGAGVFLESLGEF